MILNNKKPICSYFERFKMKKNIDVLEYLDGRHYDRKIESKKMNIDLRFYINKAKLYGGPILELACGTGRITIPIAKEGFSIIGLDLLNTMLKEAKRKSEEAGVEIEWIEGDMTDFTLNKKFNLILMPAVAFNWLLDLESIEKCLNCVKRHLNNNGRFIFNAFNPNLNLLVRDPLKTYPNAEYHDPDGNRLIIVRENNIYDKATQINKVRFHYSIAGNTIINELNLRMIFPQELDAILNYNGFKVDAKYGEFDQKPFSSDSNYQIFVCHQKQ